MSQLLQGFEVTRYGVLCLVLLCFAVGLHFVGGYRFGKKVIIECITDHKTGKITINNLSRFLMNFAVLFLVITTHFNFQIKPFFQIWTKPVGELELTLYLSYIVGAELAKKFNNKEQIDGQIK